MTKKDLKKSRSVEDLKFQPQDSQEIKELKTQITALTEQITRIKKETNQTLQTQEQKIKELTNANNKLTDHNNELRLNHLKTSDQLSTSQKNEDKYFTKYQAESKLTQQLKPQLAKCQKDLTITQQDLKSAQRVIGLRTIEPENKESKEREIDY